MKKELLDEISTKSNACYLSNLHMHGYRKQVYAAVESVEARGYPVTEWEKAASYILLEPIRPFSTSEQAKNYLLKRLNP